jgi:poly(3-hydroxybutyrate) depolymerase
MAPPMAHPGGHGRRLSHYDFGRTTVFACQADPRFAWCAYLPESYKEDAGTAYPLLVSVHGTLRDMAAYREVFVPLAEKRQMIVLAPLFPAGITGPQDLGSYKFLRGQGVDYVAVLLAMVAEARAKWRIAGPRFSLFGFSGGGHFAHRFLYARPDLLAAVSIGAPGLVTLLDETLDYWPGIRDFADQFGHPPDIAAMRRVPVQVVVGGEDRDLWEITLRPGDPRWMPGAEAAGASRIDRARSLAASLAAQGISARLDIVPGAGHRLAEIAPAAIDFLDALQPESVA